MVEYLLNAIRASAGEDITIVASVAENGESIAAGCGFMLHIADDNIVMVDGAYDVEEGLWYFTIPAEKTKGLKGRYSYCLCKNGQSLCFREPFYLM